MFELFILTLMIVIMFFVFRANTTTQEQVESLKAEQQKRGAMLAKREIIRQEMNTYLEESDKKWAEIKAQEDARMAKWAAKAK